MPNDNNRVLSRMGARQLMHNEIDNVGGGFHTLLSVMLTNPASNPDRNLDS